MIARHAIDFTWNRGFSSNSPPLRHGDQIPHPLEDSDNQIPSSPGRQRCQMPGVCPGGACWSFDLTDTVLWDLHKTAKWFHLWHLLHFFPNAGQFFPFTCAPINPQKPHFHGFIWCWGPLIAGTDCTRPARSTCSVTMSCIWRAMSSVWLASESKESKESCEVTCLANGPLDYFLVINGLNNMFEDSFIKCISKFALFRFFS